MKLYIGEHLKKLRLERELTQERLAELINVSPQAVSRWENGAAYPDITMLPSIAGCFDVSLDELLGMEKIRADARLITVYTRVCEKRAAGELKAAETLLRDALRVFPNNEGLLSELVLTLTLESGGAADSPLVEEAAALSERVLKSSTNAKLRSTTTANLPFLYLKAGRRKQAAELVRTLPHVWECRELLLPELAEDGDYLSALQKAVEKVLAVVCEKIRSAPKRRYAEPGGLIAGGMDYSQKRDVSSELALIGEFLRR